MTEKDAKPVDIHAMREFFGVEKGSGDFEPNLDDGVRAKQALADLDDLDMTERKEKEGVKIAKADFAKFARHVIYEQIEVKKPDDEKENKRRRDLKRKAASKFKGLGLNTDYLQGEDQSLSEQDKVKWRKGVRSGLNRLIKGEELKDTDVDHFVRAGVDKTVVEEWREENRKSQEERDRKRAEYLAARRSASSEPAVSGTPGTEPPPMSEAEKTAERKRKLIDNLNQQIENTRNIFLDLIGRLKAMGSVPDYQNYVKEFGNISKSINNQLQKSENADIYEDLIKLGIKCRTYSEEIGGMGSTSEIETAEGDVPKDGDPVKWSKWIREKLHGLIQPYLGSGEQRSNNVNELLNIVVTTVTGKMERNAMLYAPKTIEDQFEKKGDEIGLVRRLASLFDSWKDNRKDYKTLSTKAFEDGSSYKFPDSVLTDELLRKLSGDNGVEGSGAENVSKAVRLYWLMANGEIQSEIPGCRNLFNEKLTPEEVRETRESIARECGGAYFEDIGLMYAGFFGLVAKGNVSKDSTYSDGLAILQNIDKAEFLSDEMKSVFTVAGSKGAKKISFMPSLGEMQRKNSTENFFYIVSDPAGGYKIKEKLSGGDYNTGLTLQDLIEDGELHKVNWRESMDIFALIKKREGQAVKLASIMSDYSAADNTPAKLIEKLPGSDENTLIAKKMKSFNEALAHCDMRTKQRACFLWLWGQMENNKEWMDMKQTQSRIHLVNLLLEIGWLHKGDYALLKDRFLVSNDRYPSQYGKSGYHGGKGFRVFGKASIPSTY